MRTFSSLPKRMPDALSCANTTSSLQGERQKSRSDGTDEANVKAGVSTFVLHQELAVEEESAVVKDALKMDKRRPPVVLPIRR